MNFPNFRDNLMECPYDPSHRIRHERYQYHTVKCMKNHPGVEIVYCKFNNNHRMRSELMEEHLRTCPDKGRINVEIYRYREPPKAHGDLSSPPPLSKELVDFINQADPDWGELEPPAQNRNEIAGEPKRGWSHVANYGAARGLQMPDYGKKSESDPNVTFWGDSPDDDVLHAEGAVGGATGGLANPKRR